MPDEETRTGNSAAEVRPSRLVIKRETETVPPEPSATDAAPEQDASAAATQAPATEEAPQGETEDRLEDDPEKVFYVTDWKGHPNYHCRECHITSFSAAGIIEHYYARHGPQTIDTGLVSPAGRPLRIQR